jgi:hypothetical protein
LKEVKREQQMESVEIDKSLGKYNIKKHMISQTPHLLYVKETITQFLNTPRKPLFSSVVFSSNKLIIKAIKKL